MENGRTLHRVRIVLVEPTHPGNVGAAARAMKAMGLDRLVLVAPKRFPSTEATARAAGADDVLHEAQVVESLDDALADCGYVLGTTARPRRIEWPVLDAREGAFRAIAQAARTPVAVVFGRESAGLTNAELDRCSALVRIPAAAHFSSLNVAAAVQILAYEMRVAAHGEGAGARGEDAGAHGEDAGSRGERAGAAGKRTEARREDAGAHGESAGRRGERAGAAGKRTEARREDAGAHGEDAGRRGESAGAAGKRTEARGEEVGAHGGKAGERRPLQPPIATFGELEGFYRHLEAALVEIGYLDPSVPRFLMRRLRRLFNRAGPDRTEIGILRGILTAVMRHRTAEEPRPEPRDPSRLRRSDAGGEDASG